MITDPRASFAEFHFVMVDALGVAPGVVGFSIRFSHMLRGVIQNDVLFQILVPVASRSDELEEKTLFKIVSNNPQNRQQKNLMREQHKQKP